MQGASPDKPEIAVDIPNRKMKQNARQFTVETARDLPVQRIRPRDFITIDYFAIFRHYAQQVRQLTNIVLAVTVGVKDQFLARVSETGA